MRRLAFLLTANSDDAEDLVQTALMRALPHWARITHREDPYAYVRTVLVNARRGFWRRERGRTFPVSEVPDHPLTEDAPTTFGVRDEIRTAVASLPDGQRKVLVLRYFEDLSEAETARVLKCSAGTVKSQTARAMSRLRSVLGESRHAYLNDGRAS